MLRPFIVTSAVERSSTAAEVPLSIIVVTWNCRDLAKQCLHSVFESNLPDDCEVIVVDNASADGTAVALSTAFPRIRLIANPDNVGFARANNQAIEVARGRMLLLLNPDAFPAERGTFAQTLAFLDRHPEFAAAGCRLVFADGRHQVGDAGYRPTAATVAVHAFGLRHLGIRAHGLFMVKPDSLPAPVTDVDWICGAFFMVRSSVVRRVGPLATSTFMYAEDVEWGCRIRSHGFRIAYLSDLTVVHLQGGTQSTAAPSTTWLESLAQVYCQLNGAGSFWAFRLFVSIGFALRAAAYAFASVLLGKKHLGVRSKAMWVYCKRAWQLRPVGSNSSASAS